MKTILIIGATGSLASYVTKVLLQLNDVQVTLFARNPSNIKQSLAEKCTLIQGNAMDYNNVKNAVSGKDIVYINLAGNLEKMVNNIVRAMMEEGVKKVIAISSIGIYESPLKPILQPYKALADIIEASGLDYTIIRPDWFTNGEEVEYHITRKPEPEVGGALSRRSIADFVAKVVTFPGEYINANLGISKL